MDDVERDLSPVSKNNRLSQKHRKLNQSHEQGVNGGDNRSTVGTKSSCRHRHLPLSAWRKDGLKEIQFVVMTVPAD